MSKLLSFSVATVLAGLVVWSAFPAPAQTTSPAGVAAMPAATDASTYFDRSDARIRGAAAADKIVDAAYTPMTMRIWSVKEALKSADLQRLAGNETLLSLAHVYDFDDWMSASFSVGNIVGQKRGYPAFLENSYSNSYVAGTLIDATASAPQVLTSEIHGGFSFTSKNTYLDGNRLHIENGQIVLHGRASIEAGRTQDVDLSSAVTSEVILRGDWQIETGKRMVMETKNPDGEGYLVIMIEAGAPDVQKVPEKLFTTTLPIMSDMARD